MIDLILAVPGLMQETDLVASAPGCGIRLLRRCVDAVDLVAAAAIDPTVVVVVSVTLPRLSTDVVARLGPSPRIVGLARDPLDATALDTLGVRAVTPVSPTAADTWAAVREAILREARQGVTSARPGPGATGVWTTGVWEPPAEPGPTVAQRHGQVIAVWGPVGAPGRTTVALGVSEAIAASGRRVCLVDADTYGPSVGLALGLVEDSGGIVRACRRADAGMLDEPSLLSATHRIRGSWHVLAGLPRPERWTELGSAALDRLWMQLRGTFDVTVVDVGFCIESDESPTAWSRHRNAAATTALACSDVQLAVADGSAKGAARLASAWPSLAAAAGTSRVRIVRNRSGRRDRGWDDAVAEFGVDAPVHAVPSDVKSANSCWSRARSLGEGPRRSPLRKSLTVLARDLMSG